MSAHAWIRRGRPLALVLVGGCLPPLPDAPDGWATAEGSRVDSTDASTDGDDGAATFHSLDAQPEDGMYSDCITLSDCSSPHVCLRVLDEDDRLDGICTATGCSDPAADCDPAPGDSSVSACVVLAEWTVCALDCTASEACPSGMVCRREGSGKICV